MAAHVATPAEVRWLVLPVSAPRALRPCGGCGGIRPFASSGRFRVNAQKRRLDVWLVYRCTACDGTWNREIHARARADALAPALLDGYHRNEAALAQRHACDVDALVRAGARVEAATEVRVERPADAKPPHEGGPAVRLVVAVPCAVRLDRLLAAELGLSRSHVAARVASGALAIAPGGPAALRRALRDGTRIAAPG